jgi:hypothetical protein
VGKNLIIKNKMKADVMINFVNKHYSILEKGK